MLHPSTVSNVRYKFAINNTTRRRRDTKGEGERRERDIGDSDQKSESTEHETMNAVAFRSIIHSLSASLYIEKLYEHSLSRTVILVIAPLTEAEGEQNNGQIDVHDSELCHVLIYCLLWLL